MGKFLSRMSEKRYMIRQPMRELTNYEERDAWLAERERIGFIGSDDTVLLQNDIWMIELFSRKNGGYSIFITLDSDESWFVCDFE